MNKKNTPYLTIILSFLSVIMIGTFLLWLPIATKADGSMGFINSLFMATSSVCVTGLTVISDIGAELTIFGKAVMLVLIEIGGISFLTLVLFALTIFGVKLGISERLLMKEALNQNSASGIVRLIKNSVILSFSIQFIGALINLIVFVNYYDSFFEAVGVSIFHSISSFNNAGFDIFGSTSMINYSDNILLSINTMVLIVLGGLGFIVIIDCFKKRKNLRNLTVHSKIVLTMTSILIVSGMLVLKLIMADGITWLEALFTSVTTRTAGFTVVDMNSLSKPAHIIIILLMLIGASPCGTGGGLKTTTLFVVLVTIIAVAKGKDPIAFNRKIANKSTLKAFTLVVFSLLFLVVAVLLLSVVQPELDFDSIIFETVSAFGTVGLSTGITSFLNVASKIILILVMYCGRLGPLTIMFLWNRNWENTTEDTVQYLQERIIIG